MSEYGPHPTVTWLAVSLRDVPPIDTGWADARLSRRLAAMRYTKRRSETTLARWTAKRTVAATFGVGDGAARLAGVVITNAVDGAPEARIDGRPIDGVIAMTDRADVAVSMVISGRERIGCDLELVEPRSAAFVRDYFTPREQATVAQSSEPELTGNLIWSAKESALKVLRTGLRRDTRTVEVRIDDGNGNGEWRPLDVTVDADRHFPGWWLHAGEFILTAVTEAPTGPPQSLTNPHGLIGAVPSHAWMEAPLVED
jgi:4'-phosphopantetheinyl transferase